MKRLFVFVLLCCGGAAACGSTQPLMTVEEVTASSDVQRVRQTRPDGLWVAVITDPESPLSIAFNDLLGTTAAERFDDFAELVSSECEVSIGSLEDAADPMLYFASQLAHWLPGKALRLQEGFGTWGVVGETGVPAIDQATFSWAPLADTSDVTRCIRMARAVVYLPDTIVLREIGRTFPDSFAWEDVFLDAPNLKPESGYGDCMSVLGYPDIRTAAELIVDVTLEFEIAAATADWICRLPQFEMARQLDHDWQRDYLDANADAIEAIFEANER